MAHDLNKILAEVLTHFHFDRPREIHICWGPAGAMQDKGRRCSAIKWSYEGGFFIAINPRLRRAPRHVLAYLTFHECLHIDLPPRCDVLDTSRIHWHHRAFRVAERIWPSYTKSNEWLLNFWASH